MRRISRFLFVMIAIMAAGALASAADSAKAGRASHKHAPTAKKHARIPVILDTDIGDDIDDTWAIGILLGSKDIDLRLIVTATNDTPDKTRLLAKVLEHMGRTDIPIGTGIKNGKGPHNQAKWLGDYKLAQYPGKVHADGVKAMIDCINAAGTTVTICTIGPETNLREALRRDPSIAKKARIVAMAGSVYIGYNGKKERDIEYNIARDIEAARAVLAAPWDITWAPLDSCGAFRITGDRYKRLADSKAPRAATIIRNYEQWAGRASYPKGESSILFDTFAAYLSQSEKLCEMKTVNLKIDDKGYTVPDKNGRPVHCALAVKDGDALRDLFASALTRP